MSCESLRKNIRFTRKLSYTAQVARVGGHYAAQGHLRSLIMISIRSPYATL